MHLLDRFSHFYTAHALGRIHQVTSMCTPI